MNVHPNHLEDETSIVEALKRRVDELERNLTDSEDCEDSEDDESSMNEAFIEEENIWRHVQMTRGRGDCGDFGADGGGAKKGQQQQQMVSKKSQSKLLNPAACAPSAKFQWANAKYVSLLGRRQNRHDTVHIDFPDFDEDDDDDVDSERGDRVVTGRDFSMEETPRVPASSPVHPIDYSEKMMKMEVFEKELKKKLFSANGDSAIVNVPSLMKELETEKQKGLRLRMELQKVIHECAQWKKNYEELLENMTDLGKMVEAFGAG